MRFVTRTYVSSQMKYWQEQKERWEAEGREGRDGLLPFIVISREYGCNGTEIANAAAKIFNDEYKTVPNWAVYDNQIIKQLSEEMGFSSELAETLAFNTRNQLTEFFRLLFSGLPDTVKVYQELTEIIRALSLKGNVIIMGRGANLITQDMRMGFQVKIIAPIDWRIYNLMRKYHMKRDVAQKAIHERESKTKDIFSQVFRYDIMDPNNYHLTINASKYSKDEIARLIVDAMKVKGLIKI
ncbi:MAG: cytidylate kinase-like family protein [Spirochaetes bacterium]|jgi:cytidylate kinase|nr:cytidylate kinase-like family protein [Spirochaetota bacterium]